MLHSELGNIGNDSTSFGGGESCKLLGPYGVHQLSSIIEARAPARVCPMGLPRRVRDSSAQALNVVVSLYCRPSWFPMVGALWMVLKLVFAVGRFGFGLVQL
eukprot:4669895-Pyramimonas_sp.AAC.1